jgi:hypothetical protein
MGKLVGWRICADESAPGVAALTSFNAWLLNQGTARLALAPGIPGRVSSGGAPATGGWFGGNQRFQLQG